MSSADESKRGSEWTNPEEASLLSDYTLEELQELMELGIVLGGKRADPGAEVEVPETETVYSCDDSGQTTHVAIYQKGNVDAGLAAKAEDVVELEAMR